MEINQLFGGGNAPKKDEGDALSFSVRYVAYFDDLSSRPLLYGLEKGLVPHDFTLRKETTLRCAEKLLQGELEIALVPSVEYAKSKGSWKIIPDVCIASQGAAQAPALFFNREMRTIARVAVDPLDPTAEMLLKIVLREKYELEPEVLPMSANLPEMLARADAALISGERALEWQEEFPAFIDLGEEWADLTGLPFVHAFWAGHELSLTETEVKAVRQSLAIGKENIDKICREFAVSHARQEQVYKSFLGENRYFDFGPKEKEGLTEFFHYAFYLGFIEHIPDLHFFENEEKKS